MASVKTESIRKISYLFLLLLASVIFWTPWPIILLIAPNFIGTSLSKNLAMFQHPSRHLLSRVNISKIAFGSNSFTIDELSEDWLRDNIDLRLPRLISLLYANMNYHASHHRFPSAPSYRLPLLSFKLSNDSRVGLIDLPLHSIFRMTFLPIA